MAEATFKLLHLRHGLWLVPGAEPISTSQHTVRAHLPRLECGRVCVFARGDLYAATRGSSLIHSQKVNGMRFLFIFDFHSLKGHPVTNA